MGTLLQLKKVHEMEQKNLHCYNYYFLLSAINSSIEIFPEPTLSIVPTRPFTIPRKKRLATTL